MGNDRDQIAKMLIVVNLGVGNKSSLFVYFIFLFLQIY